jgi:hypothetical protein
VRSTTRSGPRPSEHIGSLDLREDDRVSDERPTNRLAGQTSPYLLQHARNPVDWYPWGEEALERARREDRPILLSIGYAACHWCHVMERESFEDPMTASLMNEHFVSIKVDREERPDVDAVYMDAVQAMTGHGGWPLTAFLTPEGRPFYAGTYYPDEPRHGMPAFRQVLTAIADAWREQRDEIETQGRRVLDAIERAGQVAASDDPMDEGLLLGAVGALRKAFDGTWGGFGGAPKFPQPMTLEFLLRMHVRGGADTLSMLTLTLDRMASGGIYDHVGGGFHRYATDETWHVPHFEKMLYDNAQLARVYIRTWQATGTERYRRVAAETCDYLVREMQHAEGGFFSSQDADSEGVEGRFFVWSWRDLLDAAGEDVARALGARPEGNWEGANVLWFPHPVKAELGPDVDLALQDLYGLREARVHPAIDDKILAAWNGLAISALSEVGRVLGDSTYIEAAVRAADFVLTHLRDETGRLRRSWRNGRAGSLAFADDHALMAEACLTLYETTFDLRWYEEARRLAADLLRSFHDPERGGFFQTGTDAEPLPVRPKELYDNAVPSGNSVAADVLLRLALLTGEMDLDQAGRSALRLVRDGMERAPSAFGHALGALELTLSRAKEVAVVGVLEDPRTRALAEEVTVRRFFPDHVLSVGDPDDERSRELVPLLRDRVAIDGRPTAYVCEGFVCRMPVTDPAALAVQLVEPGPRGP